MPTLRTIYLPTQETTIPEDYSDLKIVLCELFDDVPDTCFTIENDTLIFNSGTVPLYFKAVQTKERDEATSRRYIVTVLGCASTAVYWGYSLIANCADEIRQENANLSQNTTGYLEVMATDLDTLLTTYSPSNAVITVFEPNNRFSAFYTTHGFHLIRVRGKNVTFSLAQ
jgi:hypothetical protein